MAGMLFKPFEPRKPVQFIEIDKIISEVQIGDEYHLHDVIQDIKEKMKDPDSFDINKLKLELFDSYCEGPYEECYAVLDGCGFTYPEKYTEKVMSDDKFAEKMTQYTLAHEKWKENMKNWEIEQKKKRYSQYQELKKEFEGD